MKNIKKVLILLIVLTILIILSIISILVLLPEKDPNLIIDEEEYDSTIILNETLERVSIRNNYYTVKNIIEEYYSCLCNLNNKSEDVLIFEYDEETEHLEEENAQKIENSQKRIYNFFDDNYIKETGLSTDNIKEKLGNYNNLYILIKDMYVRDLTESIKIYFTFGTLTEKDNSKIENFGLMVLVDSNNSTFNLYTSDYVKKHNLYELSKNKDFKEKYFNINNIENRKYNTYEYKLIDDETYAKDLLKTYSQSIKYNNIDYSYDRLHENYKINRFAEKSYYEEYLKENKKDITMATLEYYKYQKYKDYKQYICIDTNKNYYIFNETSIMNYTLILDEYTVDLPEFIEQYTIASKEDKVAMNVEKVISAINDRDYKYIYSKLDNVFKQNKFPTENDLKTYIQNNLLEMNGVENRDFSQEGDIFIYKIEVNGKNFNIIMQLGEGTEFTMSFSIE
ncbi:MAG: hypothetical protein IJE68_01205 [Clostridia bacterium]|nr:hypothetical protein [Clostridia bacterium]